MKKIIGIAILSITCVVAFKVNSFEFVLLGISGFVILFLVVAGLIRLFKTIHFNYYKIPLIILGICLLGIFSSLFRPYQEATLKSGTNSEKLKYAYNTDQNDRKQLKSFIPIFSELNRRDQQRLELIKTFYNNGLIEKPIDKFYAAFIYHHSDNSNDYKIASELAAQAAQSNQLQDHYQAQWLRKAAHDRWLLSIGKPEKYNTQGSFSIGME